MSEVKYTVRNMTKEDVPQTLDVWRETGMQEGTHCLYTWLDVDPDAFKIAVTDEGEVIGACSACIHHDDLVFVGIYCVREKYRGLGVGFKVWSACMQHVGDKNVCLNAVPGKLELYRDRGGFPIVEADWECVVNETSSAINHDVLSDIPPKGVEIEPFEDSHLPLVFDYDHKLMGYSRQKALQLSFKEHDSRTFVAVKNGECVGFGTIKVSCQEAGLIGPLYADDKVTAEALLKKLILSLPQAKGFSMMTVSNNEAANEFIRRIGCPATEECPRLYRKKKFDIDLSKVYGHFDLNFSPY